jgi:hypothetical protein
MSRFTMSNRSAFAKIALSSSMCLLVAACGSATLTCTATVSTEAKAKSVGPIVGISSSQYALGASATPVSVVNVFGTMEATGTSAMMATAAGAFGASSVPDVASFTMDVSGGSVVWPQTGTVTLTILNKADGAVISARSFGWGRSGAMIQLSSPAEVNNWVLSTGATEANAKVKYDMGGVEVQSAVGTNIVSTAVLQNNVVRARGLTQWNIDETWHECGSSRICAPK